MECAFGRTPPRGAAFLTPGVCENAPCRAAFPGRNRRSGWVDEVLIRGRRRFGARSGTLGTPRPLLPL
jgi:hypothetical protein